MADALVVGAVVLLGALTQRLTGVGFALVASPLLVLVLGPIQGVVITNVFGVATALTVYLFHVREVEYRRVLPLLVAAAVAVVPGAVLARALPAPLLAVGAGALVVLALGLSVLARRLRGIDRWPGLAGAGLLSGFMNVLAGVGGPAVTAYAVAARWEHRRFAISVQFYFAVLGALSLLARGALPELSAPEWVAACLAMVVGLIGGRIAARRVPVRAARTVCLILALIGGLAVIVRGVIGLSGG